MAQIGQTIPEFKAQAFHNGEFTEVTSESVKGKWGIFLFYPADFTFVCPTELEDMANHYEELQGLGVEVYAVSTDTHFSHKAWHDSSDAIGKIKFPMLGDQTGTITRGFDVMIEEDHMAHRGTFLVDPDGVIQVAQIHAGGIGRSAKETWFATLKLLSTCVKTTVKYAQLRGNKARKPLRQVLTW